MAKVPSPQVACEPHETGRLPDFHNMPGALLLFLVAGAVLMHQQNTALAQAGTALGNGLAPFPGMVLCMCCTLLKTKVINCHNFD
jgi:hypothetical protein